MTNRPISVLAFTPTPTHPPIQGNRQRVYDICRAMQSKGAHVTLLYYAIDGLDATSAREMRETWDQFEVVYPRGFVAQHRLARYPAIDDWYDDSISAAVRRLVTGKAFDVCIVNYAWYSRLFASLPGSVVRVIDTHDVFGDRARRFADIDMAPEWFHTSVAQESIGLNRADIVLAIQSLEAETLRERTKSVVETIGFLSAPRFLPQPNQKPARRLRVGYIGSANPFNVSSIVSFGRAVQSAQNAGLLFDVHLAGAICNAVGDSQPIFTLRGIVDSVEAFYRDVDVVVNPMLGGTGLKIKSLEALSYGKPLVATADAMTGIETAHDGHLLGNVEQVVRRLQEIAVEPWRLMDEAAVSRNVFESYRGTQLETFSRFWAEVEEEAAARRTSSAEKPTGTG
jgi:glycosyltransferase involved in cell wall biosynthesis